MPSKKTDQPLKNIRMRRRRSGKRRVEQSNGPGQLLKKARLVRRWSQADLAEKIDTTNRTVSRWEAGKSLPSLHFQGKLFELLGENPWEPVKPEPTPPSVIERQGDPPVKLFDPFIPSLPELVGRDHLLCTLRQRLCSGKDVALYGLPGVGKTALALALAHDEQILAAFPDGVLWAGLGPRPNVPGQLSRWGRLLGLSSTQIPLAGNANSVDAWAWALRDAIGRRRMLIVIDDAWKDEAARSFKVGGPDCALLVTTRFPQIARRFTKEGATAIHELSADDGLILMTRLAPEVVDHYKSAVQALVQDVGGLPLALSLMGKYLQTEAYDGQQRRMRAAIDRLRDVLYRLCLSEPQSPTERPPCLPEDTPLSLQSVIAVSDRFLDEQARTTLRALSIFPPRPNSFSEEAGVFVAQCPEEVLDALSDSGLLESNGPGRYTLHQTIADYARANQVDAIASERLIAYMVDYVEKHRQDYEDLERESNNILAALTQASESVHPARLVQGVNAFAPFLLDRGLYDLAHLHLERARHAALWLKDKLAHTFILLHLGSAALHLGDYTEAAALLHEGLTDARDLGHLELTRRLLSALHALALEQGDHEQAAFYAGEQQALVRDDPGR